jgi:hypothetical protein
MMGLCDPHGCQDRLGVPDRDPFYQVSDHRLQPSNLDDVPFSLREVLPFSDQTLDRSVAIADSAKL